MKSQEFVITDPHDPKEIFLNMALNGCGRKGKCTNTYCADNPSFKRMCEAEINSIIRDKLITGKIIIYPCHVWEMLSPKLKAMSVE